MAHRRMRGTTLMDQAVVGDFFIGAAQVTAGDTASFGVHNATGGTLTKGTLVYVSGWNTSAALPQVSKADADAAGARAQLVITADILNGADGYAAKRLELTGLNTNSASAVGDPVYLSTTAGGWTLTAPTDSLARVELVGRVEVKSASVGKVQFDLLGNPGLIVLGRNEIQVPLLPGKWTYDATIQSGAQGTVPMSGPALPVNTIVTAGFMEVITSPVGTGASIAITLQGANDIISAAAISGAPWSTGGVKAIVPVWSDMTKAVKVATSAKTPSLVITTHDLSDGVVNLFLAGYPADG